MNHLTKVHLKRLLQNSNFHINYKRYYSSRGSSSGLKLSLIVGSTTLATTAATYLYAKYDESFRNQLISAAPPVKYLFEESKPKSSPIPPSFLKKPPPKIETKNEVEKPKVENVSLTVPANEDKTSTIKVEPKVTSSEIKADITNVFDKALEEDNLKLSPDNELELRVQLKRQLYILQEFFKEQLILYKTELKRKLEVDLKNKVLEEKEKIASEYETSFKKLQQMESLLEVRDKLDTQEKATKKLWLISQTLANLLDNDRSKLGAKPILISEQIECVRSCIKENFPEDKLFNVVLDSLPQGALKNGVYSEADLIQRFEKVEKMCNQVSLIDNNYAPFYDYLKSSAYSFIRPLYQIEFNLSLNPIQIKQIPKGELDGTLEVDPKDWDTYDILKRVRFCVDNRNLGLALRYANQLNGEPRKVARDWINDTREFLEVRLALDILQSKMAAVNLYQFTLAK